MHLQEAPADIEDVAIALYDNTTPVDCPVKEYLDIEHGTYTREIFMPAGTVIIGKQHAKSCVNVIAKGKLLVKKDVGDEGTMIDVPKDSTYVFTSVENGRKLLYIIEDTVFLNVFSNVEAKCLEDVEAELVIPSNKLNKHIQSKELAWHGQQ